MLPTKELALAIDIQARSYRLLRWLAKAMDEGYMPIRRAHNTHDATDSALAWIEEHYDAIPKEARPDRKHLKDFARFFATYVTTSFDVVDNPARVLKSVGSCYCDLCSYLGQAAYLQAKRLNSGDKKRARMLMLDRVHLFAAEEDITTDEEAVERIASSVETDRSVAYSAYGYWLIQRLQGHSDGRSVLALWRKIAWHREGSPIHGFQLELADVVEAEESLRGALKRRG